jgi:hypothetical protein
VLQHLGECRELWRTASPAAREAVLLEHAAAQPSAVTRFCAAADALLVEEHWRRVERACFAAYDARESALGAAAHAADDAAAAEALALACSAAGDALGAGAARGCAVRCAARSAAASAVAADAEAAATRAAAAVRDAALLGPRLEDGVFDDAVVCCLNADDMRVAGRLRKEAAAAHSAAAVGAVMLASASAAAPVAATAGSGGCGCTPPAAQLMTPQRGALSSVCQNTLV